MDHFLSDAYSTEISQNVQTSHFLLQAEIVILSFLVQSGMIVTDLKVIVRNIYRRSTHPGTRLI